MPVNDPSSLEEVQCMIVAADVEEVAIPATDEDTADVEFNVILALEEVSTGNPFVASLSAANIRQITGIRKPLSSKDLIAFAHALSEREQPVRVVVSQSDEEITTDMILARPRPADNPSPTSKSKNVSRFAPSFTQNKKGGPRG